MDPTDHSVVSIAKKTDNGTIIEDDPEGVYYEDITDPNNIFDDAPKAYFKKISDKSTSKIMIKESIDVLKKRKAQYIFMNYLMAAFSGFRLMTTFPNMNYFYDTLELESANYSKFSSYAQISWNFKPVFGIASDLFFPFRLRLKPYIFLSCLMVAISCFTIFVFNDLDELSFTLVNLVMYTGFCITDTLAEGMTALIFQVDKKIQMASSVIDPNEDPEANNKKAFGNFYNVRYLAINIGMFLGGVLADRINIRWFYLILGSIALFMAIWTLFMFYEPKKKSFYSDPTLILGELWMLIKVILQPYILIPFIFINLLTSIPNLGDVGQFILLGLGGWTYTSLSFMTLFFGFIYFFALGYLINGFTKLGFSEIIIVSTFGLSITMLLNYPLAYARDIPFYLMFLQQIVQSTFSATFNALPTIAITGRFSEVCPKGLESTGITMLLSISNFGVMASNLLSAKETVVFNVVSGYLTNITTPIFFNTLGYAVLLLVAPAFVIF